MQTMELDTKELTGIFEGFDKGRDSLIPILQAVQGKYGWLPEDALGAISDYLGISHSEIFGVATFYTQFKFTKQGEHSVKVCQGTACHVRGGSKIMNEVVKTLGIKPGQTTEDYKFSLDRVACFGSCALSPVVVVDDVVYGRMTPQKARQLLKEIE